MPHAAPMSNQTPRIWGVALLAVMMTGLLSAGARAGDARKGVKANRGEIVVLRTVPTRYATRMEPPGVALIVDPRPNRELETALGKGSELNDAEIAALSASPVQSTTRHLGNTLTQMLGTPSTGANRQVSQDSAPPGTHPMGAIVNATSGIGNAMQQAMSTIPAPTGQH